MNRLTPLRTEEKMDHLIRKNRNFERIKCGTEMLQII